MSDQEIPNRLSDTFVCCHYCQATRQLFSMLYINEGWYSGPQKRFFCFCFLNYTKLFFCPLKEGNSSRPSPSSQLKGTERALSFLFSSQNHWFLAPLKVWKAAIPFKSRRTIEKNEYLWGEVATEQTCGFLLHLNRLRHEVLLAWSRASQSPLSGNVNHYQPSMCPRKCPEVREADAHLTTQLWHLGARRAFAYLPMIRGSHLGSEIQDKTLVLQLQLN